MDEKLFKKGLRQSLEGAVAPRANAWRALQARLPKDYELKIKGGRTSKPSFKWVWRLGLAAVGSFAVLLFAMLAFTTPQGLALARGVLQSLPVQKLLGVQASPTPSLPAPTATATPPPALGFYSQCGDIAIPICSLDQIRYLVSFPVKAPVSLPEGLHFTGATGGPDNAILVYRSADGSRSLLFFEGPRAGKVAQDVQPIGGAAVETVQVGSAAGEYLQGAWQAVAPAQTLRWIDGDILIEVLMLGDPQLPSALLDKSGLLVLAENLSDGQKAAGPTVEAPQKLSLAEVQVLAGFQVRAPDALPDGVSLDYATYSPANQAVSLVYKTRAGKLSIDESAAPQPALTDLYAYIPPQKSTMFLQIVPVGGALNGKGMYAFGSADYSKDAETQILQVQMDGLNFSIYAAGQDFYANHDITQLDMVRMAESITGVHVVTENTLDPERLTSAQDAEVFAGFPIKLPAVLPPDAKPPTFAVIQENEAKIVRIFYDCNNWFTLIETSGSAETLDSLKAQILSGKAGFDPITVNGQPGIWTGGFYSSGVWQFYPGDGTISTIWFEDGIKYELYAFYNINYSKEMFVNIANSMQPWQTASLAGAQAQAGFKVIVPDSLPAEITFDYASYNPYNKVVTLLFRQPRGGKLTIEESAAAPLPALTDIFPEYPNTGRKMTAQEVTVGGAKGGKGVYAYGEAPYYVPTNWNSYAETQVLQVQMEGLQFTIYAAGQDAATGNHYITQLEMVKMAEAITGVHTVAASQLDPERLSSAQDAEAFAGFHLKLPAQLPPDAKPPLFAVTHEGGATIVRIFYDCNNDVTLYETSSSSDTLDSLATQILNDGAGFNRITVNGQPGIWTGGFYSNTNQFLYQGDGSFHTIWFEDGIKYELYASFSIHYTKEMFVNIANSVQ